MRLIIAEKPELGRAIAKGLFNNVKEVNQVITEGDTTIIWCYGHMLELVEPEEIEEKYKSWNEDHLPIYQKYWKKKVTEGKEARVKQIGHYIKQASEIINAGDPDDEGQNLIDELLDYFQYKGKVSRVLINDNLPEKIKTAFSKLENNDKYRINGDVAYSRQMADKTFGINHSRLASIRLNAKLSVGRVQTPTLGLVVARDEIISKHIKQKYYDIEKIVTINDKNITYKYKSNDKDGQHILDKNTAEEIANEFPLESDFSFQEKIIKVVPQLPYNLATLQADMNKRFGYTLQETLDISQQLRDKFQAITYNRSDSQYLNEEHYKEAPIVLKQALENIDRELPLDFTLKSKCFNDKNVTAHHAIIPQNKAINISIMNEKQRNVYLAIVEKYAMQFMVAAKKKTSKSELPTKSGLFAYSETIYIDKGYTEYFDYTKLKENNSKTYIPTGNYIGTVKDTHILEKETNPPKRYTPATLIKDMTSIAKYVTDPTIKKILQDKDKEKKGEHGSIGTSATRSSIVDGLLKKGFLEMDGKNIISTEKGKQFYNCLPKEISKADTTARWWLIQEDIRKGNKNINDLMHEVVKEFEIIKEDAYKNVENKDIFNAKTQEIIGKCPKCGKNVIVGKTKNKNLYFYCEEKKENKCSFILYEHMKRYSNNEDDIHITKNNAEKLLADKHILANLQKKDGSMFKAYVKLKINGNYTNFEIDGFPKTKRKQ